MAWTKASKKAHSERMKAFWEQRRAANKTRSKEHAAEAVTVAQQRQDTVDFGSFVDGVENANTEDLAKMQRLIGRELVYREHAYKI